MCTTKANGSRRTQQLKSEIDDYRNRLELKIFFFENQLTVEKEKYSSQSKAMSQKKNLVIDLLHKSREKEMALTALFTDF